ncbi:hypothetical protein BCR42DRAFT_96695 [Absidia repens]|uniref:HECT-type E3 ubiquitin transferase n=1 Tax=Absidia repens TaxID=90262 RepID=A0A1X2IA61_9FUNG|nr:hypothetical protein BCR42DRAFT_96695 [Absidia repens]
MFTPIDEGKKSFVEKTRTERQKRERERLEKQTAEKQTQAALLIQRWWRQQPQHEQLWTWWDSQYLDNDTSSAILMDVYRMVGQYCLFSRRQAPGPVRLTFLCKRIGAKCSLDQSSSTQVPFYTLLMDKRYRRKTMDFIGLVMKQCLLRICTNDNSNHLLDRQLYLTGPELTTLLLYLNPSSYKPVRHPLNHNYALEKNDITTTALCILQSTLDSFFDGGGDDPNGGLLRDACVQRVERLVKLENRSKQRGKPLDKENTKMMNGIKLWLTTVTRILLFPLENAGDTTELTKAATYIWNHLLTVPLLSQFLSTMVLDRLRKWTLGAIHPLVTKNNTNNNDDDADGKSVAVVGGNGYLFLMANVVDLYQEKFMDHQEREVAYHLMDIVMHLISLATPFYSDRQRSPYTHYHPIFKWSCCPWGDQIDAAVYELVIQDQIATLWSRCFMDQLLEPILKFAAPSSLSPSLKINKMTLNTRRFLSGKKKIDTGANASGAAGVGTDNSGNTNSVPTVINSKDMAEFSMNTQLMFSMYSQLGALFTQQRKIILARIAFTPGLMSQLWLVMNHFGPSGNMTIYLDAARKNASDIEKEPLIDVLKVFCEACSLVFLTLDDIDIFQKETPFALSDLLDLGQFLNTFYFALVQQSTTTNTNHLQSNGAHHSNTLHSFQAAKRLLLQLYDLDNRHPFCPPDHWLLVSDPMMSKQSLLRLVFSSPFSKDNNPPEATQFLAQVRQGDVVPMRILQLMPHTIPFTTRLHIFRDGIHLDRASNMYTSATQSIFIRRQHVLEDGFRALSRLSNEVLKGRIRVTFVNELGVEEAGIDQGGPFKDFVTLLISEVFEPKYGLFSCTSKTNLFYPATTSPLMGSNYIHLFEFVGKV